MKKIIAAGLVVFILSGCTPPGFGKKISFEYPDIKDDFCGVHINFQFCKCAFHGEFCKQIGLSKKEANAKVQSEYKKWLEGKLTAFRSSCSAAGGIAEDDVCQYCKEGFVADNDRCVDADSVAGTNGDNATAKLDPLYNPDCSLKQDMYDRDWKKYSDIDEVIPFEERSYEAKQALTVYESMVSKMIEAFALERDIEIEKGKIAQLEEYKTALVNNIKTNLLKSFWRLTWITYSTIDTTKGLKGSYEKLLDLESVAEGLAASIKIIRTGVPPDSKLAIDTSTITGKVKSSGASVALDAVESLGDPLTIATTVVQEAVNASLPSADITEEEVQILKDQHLKNGAIDAALKTSKDDNAARETQLAILEKEIADMQPQIGEWEAKEKARVAVELVESCKELMKK